jgi:hypothetical protein
MSLNLINPFLKFGSGGGGDPSYYEELDRVTLGSAGDSLDSGVFTAKDNIMFFAHIINSDGQIRPLLRVGNSTIDTGANYSWSGHQNGGSNQSEVNQTSISPINHQDSGELFAVGYFSNTSDQEKLGRIFWQYSGAANASTAPDRSELAGKWDITSNQFDRMELVNDKAGDFSAGSELVVLGYDNDSGGGDSVFAELGTATASGSAETLDCAFTAKKYTMIQGFASTGGNSMDNMGWRLGDGGSIDSGNNYARRVAHNGSESTSASQNYIRFGGGSPADNQLSVLTFMINTDSQEKLLFNQVNRNRNTGASTAPDRFINIGKWVENNESNIIQLRNDDNNWTTDTFVKVWGFD